MRRNDSGLASGLLRIMLGPLTVLRDLRRWWLLRPFRGEMSETEKLEAVRAYTAWVRNTPPPPARPTARPPIVPTPVLPPQRGGPGPYPGRRRIAGR